ncbi:MAG TPA: hypothetical protein VKT73_13705 [Xanthobacteraceae bacterium]|nr:hypothetical protein [Xanthobacteraceae bacterium]
MTANHPHGHRHGEVEPKQAPHGHHHSHHHHAHSHARVHHHRVPGPGGIRGAARFLFCKKSGPVSVCKLLGLGFLVLASLLYAIVVTGLLPVDIGGTLVARALQEKLGQGHKVEIGETRLEQDASGRAVLRVHGITIRNAGGEVVATAPRADIGLDSGVLVGNFRPTRIDLVEAEMTLRIDENGQIDLFAGRNPKKQKQPQPQPQPVDAAAATAPVIPPPPPANAVPAVTPPAKPAEAPPVPFVYPQLAAWLDRLEQTGLDGISLAEVGLKRGTLVVENAKTGRRWTFPNTNLLISRPAEGGITFSLSSGQAEEAWSLNATIGAVQAGARAIDLVAREISPEDVMLAAGITNNDFRVESRISGILRALVAQDGTLLAGAVRTTMGRGWIGNARDPNARVNIDGAQLQANFNPDRRAVIFDPVRLQSGQTEIVLQAVADAPKDRSQIWPVVISQGQAVLGTDSDREPPLVLDRIFLRGTWDPQELRLVLDQGDVSGTTVGLALSGSISLGAATPMLSVGIASNQLPVTAAKRLWPAPIAPGVRNWIMDHVDQGLIEKLVIAANIPLDKVGKANVELPDEAVKIDVSTVGGVFRPMANLPPVRDAAVTATITGRVSRAKILHGVVETQGNRRFNVSDGLIEVLDYAPPNPKGTIRFRIDGPADALAETASLEPLKSALNFTFDPASTKGTVTANARFNLVFRDELIENEVDYLVDADLTNFSTDRVVRGQRVDNVTAKLMITPPQIQVKGDGKIAGAAANFEYRRDRKTNDADFRLAATLDDGARARVGLDLAPWLTGPVGVKAQGRLNDRETQMNVEADLAAAEITDLVPGWSKAAGKAAKATYRLSEHDNIVKIDDLSVTGAGTSLRGSVEFEADGGIVSVNFPTFQLSDGDKASLKAERAPDGTLKAIVRGDVFDLRGMLKRMTEGSVQTGPVQSKGYRPHDLDLELRVGAASGNNGEVIRQLELRVLRRNGEIRSFALLGKIGRDGSIAGELRARDGGRPVLYITSSDAGALFRYADYYARIQGGEGRILFDAPHFDGSAQEGEIDIRNYSIRGEPALDRLVSAAPVDRNVNIPSSNSGIPFSNMQITFNRTPGKFQIKQGLMYGDLMGAKVDGVLDYALNYVKIRGNYIPAYGLNNAAARAFFFLGSAPNEGLFAVAFEIAGPATGPTLRVNPLRGMIPGVMGKLFDFPALDSPPPTVTNQ